MRRFGIGARELKQRLFVGAAAGVALIAHPAAAEGRHAIRIAAGPLDAALLSLAQQTHEQLLYAPDLVAGRKAPAVAGTLSAEEALARLLGHSDIEVTRAGPDVMVLRRRGAVVPAGAPASPPTAEPVRPAEANGARPFVGEPETPSPRRPEAGGAPSQPPAANTVAEVEVTGTHIRGASPAAPLLVLSHDDLVRTGQTNVADALRTLPQNFGGGAGEGTVTTGGDKIGRNSAFAQGLNLRGLGNSATLVLVNGHRLGGSGSFGDFTDLSTIPTAAVERVEVLLDGASAIYGSDAVAGVVNIILRRDFDGAETRLLAGVGAHGAPAEYRLAQTLGRRWATGGFVVAYEGVQRENLPDSARAFARSADLRPFGGSDWRTTNSAPGNILKLDPVLRAFVPGWAIPKGQDGTNLKPSDLLAGVTNLGDPRIGEDILPQQTIQTIYLAADQDLGPRIRLTGDIRYNLRRFSANLAPGLANLTVTAANPFFVSPNGTSSETIAYSFANDLHNPVQDGHTRTFTASGGAEANLFGDWRANAYATFARETDDLAARGVVNTAFLNEALGTLPDNPATPFSAPRDGFFNPFVGVPGANKPAVLAFISQGFSSVHTEDEVSSASLEADGSLWRLPGGALKLAFGAQIRRERFARGGSNFVTSVTPLPGSTLDVSRRVTAAYAELQAPLFGPENRRPGLERLDLSIAGRIEDYQVVGSTSNPKVGVLWSPAEGVNVRLTYGTSFRAPALREVDDLPVYSPTLLPLGAARIRTLFLGGGNADLKPETATTWTAGVDVAPPTFPGFTAGFTWYDIRFHDRIGQPALQNLAGALTDPTLASFVERISPTTNPADLARITALLSSPFVSTLNGVFAPTDFGAIVDGRFVNTAKLQVSGIDLRAGYATQLGDDRLDLAASGSYVFHFDQQVTPTSSTVDEIGLAGFPVRFRGRASAEWTHGELTGLVAANYASAARDPLGPRIRSQLTFDAQLRWDPSTGPLKGTRLVLNVRNLFDRDPPFYNSPAGYGYDAANADPVGRFVSLELIRRW